MKSARYCIALLLALCWAIRLDAMEKDESFEAPVMYCLDAHSKHYVVFYPTVLENTLNKIRAVGDANPYALVCLKQMVDPFDRQSLNHRAALRGNKRVCQSILQQYGVLGENNRLDLNTKAIVELAVTVGLKSVWVAKPAWFEERRVTSNKGDDESGADTLAEDDIGGVEYGKNEVVMITARD